VWAPVDNLSTQTISGGRVMTNAAEEDIDCSSRLDVVSQSKNCLLHVIEN
jgi:hypothetical protein